eukprot:scaffold3821_cov134-Isochrysis_galbana.AAC.8
MQQLRRAHAAELSEMVAMLRAGAALIQGRPREALAGDGVGGAAAEVQEREVAPSHAVRYERYNEKTYTLHTAVARRASLSLCLMGTSASPAMMSRRVRSQRPAAQRRGAATATAMATL